MRRVEPSMAAFGDECDDAMESFGIPLDGLKEAELTAVEDRHYNLGFQEALAEAKAATLQEGFDAGYRAGFKAAFPWTLRQIMIAGLREINRLYAPVDLDALLEQLLEQEQRRDALQTATSSPPPASQSTGGRHRLYKC